MSLDKLLEVVPSGSVEEAIARGLNFDALPAHVAIIMDGNGRWPRNAPPTRRRPRACIDSARTWSSRRQPGYRVLKVYSFSSRTVSARDPSQHAHTLLKLNLRLELDT